MTSSEVSLLIAIIAIAIDLLVRVLAIIFVPRNRRPGSAMAWLLAIFFIPYIGVLFYLLIGSPRLGRKRRAKQDEINAFIKQFDQMKQMMKMMNGQMPGAGLGGRMPGLRR